MSNIDKLQDLYVKSQKCKIKLDEGTPEEKVIELDIFPLEIADLNMFKDSMADEDKYVESIIPLIAKSLKVEPEQVKNLAFVHTLDIIEAIHKINGVDKVTNKPGMTDKIKKFQQERMQKK